MLSFNILVKNGLKSAITTHIRCLQTTQIDAAARKGTREKARKKKVKVEVQKVAWIPHNVRKRDKLNLLRKNKHIDDSWKQSPPADNCWIGRYYKWPIWTVQQAIQSYREANHPTMYNRPNAPIFANVELNMIGEKQTRFMENFTKMSPVPHPFEHGEDRKILVFVKGQELIQEAINAGATLAGGVDLVKEIQNGDLLLPEYPFIVAHPNMLADMLVIRGLMKRKFPNPKADTLGADIVDMVKKFHSGIRYSVQKDEYQKDFALITAQFGFLDMPAEHLEANLSSLLQDLNKSRPRRTGKFVTRVIVKCPPSGENLKIDPFLYIPEDNIKIDQKGKNQVEEAESDDEEAEKKATASSNTA